jgi:diacylglycerol O-acyltransferase
VPLAHHQALGIAIMSYDGRLGFGLLGDYDAMPDLEQLAADLETAIAALSGAAGVSEPRTARKPAPETAKV